MSQSKTKPGRKTALLAVVTTVALAWTLATGGATLLRHNGQNAPAATTTLPTFVVADGGSVPPPGGG